MFFGCSEVSEVHNPFFYCFIGSEYVDKHTTGEGGFPKDKPADGFAAKIGFACFILLFLGQWNQVR
jgi:hypothetical protein